MKIWGTWKKTHVKDFAQDLDWETDGVWTPFREKHNLSVTFPFLTSRDRDVANLKSIRAQLMSHSRPWRIHLQPLVEGILTPDLVREPLHFTSGDLTCMFMAKATKITEMVDPVIITFSSQYHADVSVPRWLSGWSSCNSLKWGSCSCLEHGVSVVWFPITCAGSTHRN